MTADWHNAKTDPPKKNGRYIIFCKTYISIAHYCNDLFAIDDYEFWDMAGQPGWYDYDSEVGYYIVDNVTYWTELPEYPVELEDG